MIIRSCHVENFGKLHQRDFAFADGLNIIAAGNGAGKSTLAAFITVMYYGFDGERLRDDVRNERHRYAPWQDGIYGGSVTFSLGDDNWRIERTFGTKNGRNDTLAVYDADTGLRTEKFGETPGDIIFSVDRASFERTVFIGQLDCVTAATPGISAKIGRVSEDTADMGRYEEAQRWLKSETDRLTPHRKTGQIARMDAGMAALAADAARKVPCEEMLDRTGRELQQLRNRADALSDAQKKTVDAMDSLSTSKDRQALLLQDETLRDSEQEAAGRVRSAEAEYPAGLPEKDEIEKYLRLASGGNSGSGRGENSPLTAEEEKRFHSEEQLFGGGVPAPEEAADMIRRWEDCTRRKNESVRMQERADGISRLLRESPERQEGRSGGGKARREETGSAHRTGTDTAGRKGIPVIFAGIVLLLIGAAAGALPGLSSEVSAAGTQLTFTGLRLIFFIAGALLCLAGVFRAVSSGRRNRTEADDGRTDGNDYGDAEEELRQLTQRIRREEEKIEEEEQEISGYLSRMNIRASEDEVTGELYRIREEAVDYRRLSERRQQAAQRAKGTEAEIRGFLLSAGLAPGDDPENQLMQMLDARKNLDMLTALWQTATAARKKFEEAHPDIFSGGKETGAAAGGSMEALSARFRSLKDERESVQRQIYACEKKADGEAADLEHIRDSEELLQKQREERSRAMHRYGVLTRTAELLEKARIRFSARYMDPLKRSFDRYYAMFAPDDGKIYEMDANLNIAAREGGILRDTAFLSEGYQDTIGLCRRMAMADAMYPDEKPFLVMDDPFVSLDDRRYAGAMHFLDQVSQEYQILYFTCRKRDAGKTVMQTG